MSNTQTKSNIDNSIEFNTTQFVKYYTIHFKVEYKIRDTPKHFRVASIYTIENILNTK